MHVYALVVTAVVIQGNTYIQVESCWIRLVFGCLWLSLVVSWFSSPRNSSKLLLGWILANDEFPDEIRKFLHVLFVNLENAIAFQVTLCRWRTCAGRCFQCWNLVTFCVIGCSCSVDPWSHCFARVMHACCGKVWTRRSNQHATDINGLDFTYGRKLRSLQTPFMSQQMQYSCPSSRVDTVYIDWLRPSMNYLFAFVHRVNKA